MAAARQATHQQRWKEAAGLWHEIFLLGDEHSREACIQTARALIELRDPESAQNLVELGLQTFPQDVQLYELKGNALEAQGFRRAAETAYENALGQERDRSSALLSLASLRCDLGLYGSALELLEPRIANGTAGAREQILAAKAYKAERRYPEAYTCYERAFLMEPPSAEQLVCAASMCVDDSVRKKDARATALSKAWLTQAVALDPQNTLGHMYLGVLAEDAGETLVASRCYHRAVETDPACITALTALATLENKRGEHEMSRAMAQRALALEKDPARRAALEKLANPEPPQGEGAGADAHGELAERDN